MPDGWIRISLQWKLALLSLLLLLFPLMGLSFLKQLEAQLQANLADNLLINANAIAASLAADPASLADSGALITEAQREIYVNPAPRSVRIDGFDDEWVAYQGFRREYRGFGEAFDLMALRSGSRLLLFLGVTDDQVVYRDLQRPWLASDRLSLEFEAADGQTLEFQFAPAGPGRVTAERISAGKLATPEPRIQAQWAEVTRGYQLELRIPEDLYRRQLLVKVDDVDQEAARVVEHTLMSSSGRPEYLLLPSDALERQLARFRLPEGRRIWVLDRRGRVLARRGELQAIQTGSGDYSLLASLLEPANREFTDPRATSTRLQSDVVRKALTGASDSSVQPVRNADTAIALAAAPLQVEDDIIGALVLEETVAAVQLLQRQATANLLSASFLVFLVLAAVMIALASRFSRRLLKLRNQAEDAVDSRGRLRASVPALTSRDEVGDLSRSFATLTRRLQGYHDYLERLASRLSHELRTPLAIVRTSLDNLTDEELPEQTRDMLNRAREGSARLSGILSRLAEASRLEQTIAGADMQSLDLVELLRQCVAGYRGAWPQTAIEFETGLSHRKLQVAPELLVQMLDKLVANAVDFSDHTAPIRVSLANAPRGVVIAVRNAGILLETGQREAIFESMVSHRSSREAGNEAHLGLGLYLVTLIVEFHGGRVSAENLVDGSGVEFRVYLPDRSVSFAENLPEAGKND